ncbi:nuclease-related domain-containing protein [Sporosarcina sp. NCCP-2716]|uniref:nuclease-related domain-containing protein n=1 Tax=Sporosarcina sp. NCCP-2716 TaxID=2943679 RepID=UPI00203BDE0F|nr:nuclease-related domain-containing protein [Sporosarcina sp. NCCP-2716]
MKSRKSPAIAASLSAAVRRLVPDHPKAQMLQSRLSAVQAGYAGEQIVDRVLAQYEFQFPHAVFHDLSLHSSTRFQIDTLFVTSTHAVILEVKNIAGTLVFRDHPPQLIRTLDNGQTASFESPIFQVERKIELLQDWMKEREIHLPVCGAIVLAHSRSPVAAETACIPILYPSGVPSFLRNLPASPIDLPSQEFSTLNRQLLDGHQDYQPAPIAETYSLTPSDFINGVLCKECPLPPRMVKNRYYWTCPVCGQRDKDADSRALRDWFTLFGGPLSNEQCRRFLHLPDRHAAYRVLRKMGLTKTGGCKNRRYLS